MSEASAGVSAGLGNVTWHSIGLDCKQSLSQWSVERVRSQRSETISRDLSTIQKPDM